MLDGRFTSVAAARSKDDFQAEVCRFTEWLGFSTVAAMVGIDVPERGTVFEGVDVTPPAYRDMFENPERCHRDPVMQHCKTYGSPIVWMQDTYLAAGKIDMWEEQAAHGYKVGIAVALHLPKGRHFFVGVDGDSELPDDVGELTRIVSALTMFAAMAHEPALQIFVAANDSPLERRLTFRELECLRWTIDGKTAWEVDRILSISEHTAARHLHHAARKLGCVSKHQAMVKALRLGLIR